MMSHY